jgi:hypothetical protein
VSTAQPDTAKGRVTPVYRKVEPGRSLRGRVPWFWSIIADAHERRMPKQLYQPTVGTG